MNAKPSPAKPNSRPTVTVHATRAFRAPPERVFDAWLDPATAREFLFATPAGEMTHVEIAPRVGGTFTITERRDGAEAEHTGEYLEIMRPRRLVFTFGVPKYTADVTRVTIDIEPATDGCELTLTHEGVWADYEERTKQGWTTMLEGLAAAIA